MIHEAHPSVHVPDGKQENHLFKVTGPASYAWVEGTMEGNKKLQPGEVQVSTVLEVPSPGTFRGYHTGDYAKLHGFISPNTGLYTIGRPQENYPIAIGYAEAGVVVDSRHPSFKPGQLVGGDYTFQTLYTGNAAENPNALWRINPDLHPSLASFPRKLLPIVGNAILHAVDALSGDRNLEVGDIRAISAESRIIVNGAGPLGILGAKWLQELGTQQVVIVDIDQERIDLAKRMGIDAYNPNDYQGQKGFQAYVKEELMSRREGNADDEHYGPGADAVLEFSGAPAGLANAFDLTQNKGVIVLAGMYPEEFKATNMYQQHISGQTLVGAQIGDVPRRQRERWGRRNTLSAFGEDFLLAPDVKMQGGRTNGDTIRKELITHVAPFATAEVVYQALMDNNAAIITDYARVPAIKTTGYGLFIADHLPSAIVAQFHPDSTYMKEVQTREIIDLYERKLESLHTLEMGGGYRATVNEGALTVENAQGQVMFENATGSIELSDGRVISTLDAKVTQNGNTLSLEVSWVKDQPDIKVAIAADEDKPGLRITQEIINTTGEEIRLDRFTGLDIREGLGGVDPKKMWASAMGWSIWEPPIEGIVDQLPQTNQIAIRPHNDDSRYDIVAKTSEDGVPIPWAVALRDVASDINVFMGYLPRDGRPNHIGVVEPRENGIAAWNDGEGVVIPAGEGRKSEELVVHFGQNSFEARAQFAKEYAERVGVIHTERERPENGFVTWYDLFNNIDPTDVPKLIDATANLRERGIEVDYFTLDDVHNPARSANFVPPGNPEYIENFLSAFKTEGEPYRFGDNVKTYAQYCKEKGLRPEIWMSPFIVSSRSPVFEQMQKDQDGKSMDMLLKNRDGEVFVTHYHPEQDAEFYALDLTNEKSQELLRNQLRFFTDNEIEGFKFDFVYPGAMQGQREDKTKTGTEAYNIGLKIIQEETINKGKHVLWGGQPIYETAGPWVGRLAPDSEAVFGIQFNPLPHNEQLRRGKCLRNAGANTIERALEGVHLYGGGVDFDPTPVAIAGELPELREPTSTLSAAEVQFSLAVGRAAGSHGRIAFGHDPRLVTDELAKRYRNVSETTGDVARLVQINREGYPLSLVRHTKDGPEVTVFNFGLDPTDITIDRKQHGIPDSVTGRVLFPDSSARTQNGEVVFLNVPIHGAQVWRTLPA